MFIKKKCILAVPLLALCVNVQLQAQEVAATKTESRQQIQRLKNDKLVTGVIIDAATGKPIESARVTFSEFTAGISDKSGKFSIKVPDYGVAVRIEAEGYQSKEVALKGKNVVTAYLYEENFQSFYDDVTTPFTTATSSHVPEAAVSVKTDGSWNNRAETPDAYLQGRVAGLQAIRRSGTANVGANLFIRGYNSLYATSQPLIVVDGVLYDNDSYNNSLISGYYNNPLAYIDLKDVDNMTVLKDGSSIYGSKGSNGVIIITTARAKQQATKIDVALYTEYNQAPENLPVMNAGDFRTYLSEVLQTKGLSYNDIQALPYMNDSKGNPDYYRYHYDNNWQNKVFRNSMSQNGYLKITGGDNIAKYGLSIGFLKNQGILSNTDMNRYNTRFNADLNLSRRLTAATNLSFTYYDQTLKNTGISAGTNPILTALVKAPFLPANEVADNGVESPALADRDTFRISNPTALIETMQGNNKSYRFLGNVKFNYLLTDHLSIGTTIAITVDKVRESFFIPQIGIVSDTLKNAIAKNRSGSQVSRMFNVFNDTKLSYSKRFNTLHQFDARLGVRYSKTTNEQDFGLGYNSATDQLTGVGYGLNTLRQIGGSQGQSAWLNTYLNAEYNYAGKYFASFNVASDGSSRFGTNAGAASNGYKIGDNAYAVFPSFSAAWLISSEKFMNNQNLFDVLKLRGSIGLTGNDDIGNFTSRKYYVTQNLLGISGLVRGNFGNPDLQWETVTKMNAGIDAAILKERVNLSVDVYQNKTDKMIIYEQMPSYSGLQYRVNNSGGMKTTGIEATVNARVINHNNLKWDIGFNIAHSATKVTKLPAGAIYTGYADGTIITAVGSAPNLFYGYKTNGVFASDAEAAASGLVKKNADGSTTPFKGGDVRFVNTTGSDNVIDESDRQVIGDPNPDFYGGINTRLSWKDFTLEGLLTFSQGNDVYNYTRRQLESMSGYENQTQAVVNRWRTDGQVTNMPKASWGDPMGNSRFSDRWIEDGSYLRLRTLSVTYKVPFKPGNIKYVHIFATGNNLVTFTKYLGYDPEFSASTSAFGQGVDVTLEPQYKSAQLGVRVGL